MNEQLTFDDIFEEMVKAGALIKKKDQNGVTFYYANPGKLKTPIKAEKVNYPIDKPNSNIWKNIVESETGQYGFFFDTTAREAKGIKAGKEALVVYNADFSELEKRGNLEISKKLTPFDKRCYIAVGALFNAGNDTMSYTKIYELMGGKSKPTGKQLEKIDKSIEKMMYTRLSLDNTLEARVYSYERFVYEGYLLPCKKVKGYVQGGLAEGAIALYEEPPLIAFARQRGHITTFNRELLAVPLNMNDNNLDIQDYLIERIARMKRDKENPKKGQRLITKILFKTLYDACRITAYKQKERAQDKIRACLEHYKAQKYIKGYKIEKEGITIFL